MSSDPYGLRQALVEKLVGELEPFAQSIVLCGSLAYGDPAQVTDTSDIDLIVVTGDLSAAVAGLLGEDAVSPLTIARHFEGVCLKLTRESVKISVHILTPDTLTIISLAYVADLRLYRPVVKPENYRLLSFNGTEYDYGIKNIELPDCQGYRTIVPVGFIQNDTYYVGIHRDKLMSSPRILKDANNLAQHAIHQNWRKTYSIFLTEKARRQDDASFRLSACLAKYSRFSEHARDHVRRIEQELALLQ